MGQKRDVLIRGAEQTVRNIRRATRRKFSAEEKIRIVLEGLRGEDSIAELMGLSDKEAKLLNEVPPTPNAPWLREAVYRTFYRMRYLSKVWGSPEVQQFHPEDWPDARQGCLLFSRTCCKTPTPLSQSKMRWLRSQSLARHRLKIEIVFPSFPL